MPAISTSALVVGAVLAAFVFWLVMNGRLKTYMQIVGL